MKARNIKPGFFKNEELGELPFEARILFMGLWCLADREGRLEYRPKKIKAELFPYDTLDVTPLLAMMADKLFIKMYTAGGNLYIQINNFKKHQNPHHTEKASQIPPKPLNNGDITVKTPLSNGGNPADSLIHGFTDSLIPDSLIPDSLIPVNTFTADAEKPAKRKKKPDKAVPYWQEMVDHVNAKFQAKKGAPYPFDGRDWKPLRSKYLAYQPWGIMALWDLYLEGGTYWGPRKGFSLSGFFEDLPVLLDRNWKSAAEKYRDALDPQGHAVKELLEIMKGQP